MIIPTLIFFLTQLTQGFKSDKNLKWHFLIYNLNVGSETGTCVSRAFGKIFTLLMVIFCRSEKLFLISNFIIFFIIKSDQTSVLKYRNHWLGFINYIAYLRFSYFGIIIKKNSCNLGRRAQLSRSNNWPWVILKRIWLNQYLDGKSLCRLEQEISSSSFSPNPAKEDSGKLLPKRQPILKEATFRKKELDKPPGFRKLYKCTKKSGNNPREIL